MGVFSSLCLVTLPCVYFVCLSRALYRYRLYRQLQVFFFFNKGVFIEVFLLARAYLCVCVRARELFHIEGGSSCCVTGSLETARTD